MRPGFREAERDLWLMRSFCADEETEAQRDLASPSKTVAETDS